MPEEAFFDAYHLKRDKARMLTRFVGEQMTTLTAHPERSQPVKPASALTQAPGGTEQPHLQTAATASD